MIFLLIDIDFRTKNIQNRARNTTKAKEKKKQKILFHLSHFLEKFNIRCNSNFLNHTYVGIIYKIYLYLKKKKKNKCSKLCKKPYQHIFQKQNVIYLRKIQFTANIVLLEAWFNNHSVIFYIFDGSQRRVRSEHPIFPSPFSFRRSGNVSDKISSRVVRVGSDESDETLGFFSPS